MVKVSVIVPVYNVEKYLERCVNSLINQEEKNIEIILINDGSKDKSYEIMRELSKKDTRIRIYTQENKGVAATRNRGILLSQGKYIYFADSDDFVDEKAVSTLLAYAEKYNTNYVRMACLRDISNSNGKVISSLIYKEPTFVKRENFKEKVFDTFLNKYSLNQMGVFLVKREFLLKNNILFDEGSFYAEDMVFAMKIFMKLENAVFLPYAYYHYINNANSITTKVNYEAVQAKINEAVKNYSYLFVFFEKFKINNAKKINRRVSKEVRECIIPIYSKNIDFNKKKRIEIIDYAKKVLDDNNIKHNLTNSSDLIDFFYLIKYKYFYGTLKPIAKKILYR